MPKTISIASSLFLFSLAAVGPSNVQAGTISFTPLSSDATSGISALNTYTHAVDFNGDGAVINGVTFLAGSQTGANYTLTGSLTPFSGNNQNELPAPAGNGINDLADTFFYGGPVQVLTLNGLIPNASYRAGFLVAGWGGAAQLLKGSDDNIQRLFDRDGDLTTAIIQTSPVIINFDYTASALGAVDLTFTEETLNNSFHHYGFFNQLINVPEPSGAVLMACGFLGSLSRRSRKNRA